MLAVWTTASIAVIYLLNDRAAPVTTVSEGFYLLALSGMSVSLVLFGAGTIFRSIEDGPLPK